MSTVLVTGGSGFIGGHVISKLLAAGHTVRTTVRDPGREGGVRALLRRALGTGEADDADRLRFAVADLTRDAGWAEAAAGCEYVLHVASPFPAEAPAHEDALIVPARDGTLRVLAAARAAGVKRVVLTSSFAAIGYGQRPANRLPYDETFWTDPEGAVSAYVKSKTLAERAAWDFVAAHGDAPELAVVNPVGVFGPVLGADYASSILIVRRMLDGAMPACPRVFFGVVDVRDVADLHLSAMTNPAAKGERFLAVAGDFISMLEMARVLRRGLGSAARRTPRVELPDWAVRLAARFVPAVRQALPRLGQAKNATSAKARRVLGWSPRAREAAIVATGESLLRLSNTGVGSPARHAGEKG